MSLRELYYLKLGTPFNRLPEMGQSTGMSRSDWILTYLYSPGYTGKVNEPVEGSIPLMKGLFLLEEDRGVSMPYVFKPDMFGPLCLEVYDDLNYLTNNRGEVIQEVRPNQRWKTFRLTERGIAEAKEVYIHLPEETRQALREVKTSVGSKKLTELIRHVYDKYPAFARNSILNIP